MRFNPCFNGTYSLTNKSSLARCIRQESFNPCFNGTYSLTKSYLIYLVTILYVLILVLMELTL